jgi:hypothetical protein
LSSLGGPVEQGRRDHMREIDDETEVALMIQRRPCLHAMFLERARDVSHLSGDWKGVWQLKDRLS